MVEENTETKPEEKSIVKSDDFDKKFSELEQISEKAKAFRIKINDERRRIQEDTHEPICDR